MSKKEYFGSNVVGINFGRGGEPYIEWTCLCGTVNERWRSQCCQCKIERKLAKEAQE